MCGLIFHKDPSTGLHTLMAFVSPLKITRKYHMPWIDFMNGMSHYYLGGGGGGGGGGRGSSDLPQSLFR